MSANDASIRRTASLSPRSICSASACSRRRRRSAISSITRRRSPVWASSSSSASATAACADCSSSSRSRITEARWASDVVNRSAASASIRASASPISCRWRCSRRSSCVPRFCWARSRSSDHARSRSSTRRSTVASASASSAGDALLPLDELAAPLLGDPPLLLGEQRERVGPAPGDPALEVGAHLLGLFRDHPVDRLPRLGERRLVGADATGRPGERRRAGRGDRGGEQPGRGDRDLALRPEGEGDPAEDRGGAEDAGHEQQLPEADWSQRRQAHRHRRDDTATASERLEHVLEHRRMVGILLRWRSPTTWRGSPRPPPAARRPASWSPRCSRPSRRRRQALPVRVRDRRRRAELARPRRRRAGGRGAAGGSRRRLDRGALRAGRGGRGRRRPRRAAREARRAAPTENPDGIDEAEEALLELQRVIGAPPALATPATARRDRPRDPGARARARRRAPGLAVRGRDARRGRRRRRAHERRRALLPASPLR